MLKRTALFLSIAMATAFAYAAQKENIVTLLPIGTYQSGVFNAGAAEIVAHDPETQTLFVINAADKTVDIRDISNPAEPALLSTIDVTLEIPDSGGINSVAVHGGLVAIAVEHDNKQENGWVAFYDTVGHYLNHVDAGALPDMVTFTHNGNYVLLANEGEPRGDYQTDPEGSVTIVDIREGVLSAVAATAGFSSFNGAQLPGVRISGPGASVAEDLEPEYIQHHRIHALPVSPCRKTMPLQKLISALLLSQASEVSAREISILPVMAWMAAIATPRAMVASISKTGRFWVFICRMASPPIKPEGRLI